LRRKRRIRVAWEEEKRKEALGKMDKRKRRVG
jgi:hypothetical protein